MGAAAAVVGLGDTVTCEARRQERNSNELEPTEWPLGIGGRSACQDFTCSPFIGHVRL